MKILHLCLAAFYIDAYAYQENILPRINKEDGHEVLILASTETYIDNKKLGYVLPRKYKTECGVNIERLQYKRIVNDLFTHKLRVYPDLYSRIKDFSPDVIMCHDLSFGSVLDVLRYKKERSNVKIYADTHSAKYNSGLNWLSLNILHRVYYRYLIRKVLPYLEKYFYIGESERVFSVENYGVNDDLMEYYPLGGLLFGDDEYEEIRAKRRKELGIKENERLYVHSGKMDAVKRTSELIEAYSSVEDNDSKLVIIGSIPQETISVLEKQIDADKRVIFLGWKNSSELQEYLCACDLYCQPGSPSATMQNAVCNRCAIMAYPHLPYTTHLDWGNIAWVESEMDMENLFRSIIHNPEMLTKLKDNSYRCARELLDYRKIAARIYQ